jgi:carboxypeptidase family protein
MNGRRFLGFLLYVTVLAAGALASASDGQAAQPPSGSGNRAVEGSFSIAGTVVSALSGAPLARALVLVSDTHNPEMVLRMVTAEDGHFEFHNLKAGKYSLQGAKRGFQSAAYEQHEQFSTAIVTGPDLDTHNLVLRLSPLAFLSGKVTDELGDPVRQARVSLFRTGTLAGRNRVTIVSNDSTDDQGYYEFPAVPPGDFFVSATGEPWYAVYPSRLAEPGSNIPPSKVSSALDVVYPTTSYGGATESESATPIAVKAGDRLQFDIHLSPVPALHVLVHVNEQQGYSVPQFQKHVFDSTEWVSVRGSHQIAPGVLELTGLAAGRYAVTLHQQGSQQTTEMNLSENGQELDFARSEPTASVKLKMNLPPGERPPRQLFVALQDARRRVAANQAADASGSVSFENIAPGKYKILVGAAGKVYSVTRLASQGVELPAQTFEATPGAALELAVYLAGGVVDVEGVVKRGDKPAAGIMVALVPNDPQAHLELFRRDQSDLDGSFVLRGVVPGAYTVVAVEDAWGFAWLEPDALSPYLRCGQNVTLSEPMKGSITLPLPVQVQPR